MKADSWGNINCPFCHPNVEDDTFMESENFRAIYNISPILPGHSLVIPKQHLQSLIDLSDAALCEMMLFARSVVKVLLRAFEVSAFNWTIQEGTEAGQTIPHLHLHLIPRQDNDLKHPGDWYPLLRERLNNHSEIIDSESRTKLTRDERRIIVIHLRQVARDLGITQSPCF